MHRQLLAASALAIVLALGPVSSTARASFHLMKIVEVFPGTIPSPSSQYIVLQMYAGGQSFVSGHSVIVYDAAGVEVSRFTFTANVANGANQATILIATPLAETTFGVTADLTMIPVLPRAGGMVCFDAIDCVAWGSYSGGSPSVGTPFSAASGLVLNDAAIRRLDVAGGATVLDGTDDTNDSANDFIAGTGRPRNNAGDVGTVCGDAVVTSPEACDDGDSTSGDGCDVNCTATACGNGVVTSGETCDDGDTTSGDGCDANCTPTGCGNGIVTAGETCEPPSVGACDASCQMGCASDGECADGDPCTTNERCVAAACVLDMTPTDDSEPCTTDGCGASGVFHDPLADGTECVLAAGPTTRAVCISGACGASSCGDGFVDGSASGGVEECDDGNTDDTDSCTAACVVARCGDGIVQAGVDECDDGNGDDTDACLSACTLARCGDGAIQAGVESCDDGADNGMPGRCALDCESVEAIDAGVDGGASVDAAVDRDAGADASASVDAAVRVDAGLDGGGARLDAGSDPAPAAGCGCRAQSETGASGAAGIALFLAAIARLRARRRRAGT